MQIFLSAQTLDRAAPLYSSFSLRSLYSPIDTIHLCIHFEVYIYILRYLYSLYIRSIDYMHYIISGIYTILYSYLTRYYFLFFVLYYIILSCIVLCTRIHLYIYIYIIHCVYIRTPQCDKNGSRKRKRDFFCFVLFYVAHWFR